MYRYMSELIGTSGGTTGLSDQAYIDGNQLRYNDQNLFLAGAHMILLWSTEAVTLGNDEYRENSFDLVENSGGNYVQLGINSELAHSGNPEITQAQEDDYRYKVETLAGWARDHNLFYSFGFHAFGTGMYMYDGTYAGPGHLWNGVANPYTRQRAIEVARDWLAPTFMNDKAFIGLDPLNEPATTTYAYWTLCTDYYRDIMDAVLAVDPHFMFLLEPPAYWGGRLDDWPTRGYMTDVYGSRFANKIIYNFHNYYYNCYGERPTGEVIDWGWDCWGYPYYLGNQTEGDARMDYWHNVRITPTINNGYPVICTEYGTKGTVEMYNGGSYPTDNRVPIPGYDIAHHGQMQDMNNKGIHYCQFHIAVANTVTPPTKGDRPHAMLDRDEISWNESADLWEANLPASVVRP